MANSPNAKTVNIRHSKSGKLDVVKGAISERLTLDESFVRKNKTLKSYGTLVTLIYGDDAARLFPNPQQDGAVPFEQTKEGLRLKVIEWAVPKVSRWKLDETGPCGVLHLCFCAGNNHRKRPKSRYL